MASVIIPKEETNSIDRYVLYGHEVWVVGGDRSFNWLFASGGAIAAKKIEDADFVLFTGGADVSPEYYNQTKGARTRFTDPERDKREKETFEYCDTLGIPMIGVCRGAQFLHVMNEGELYQDVTGHLGDHMMIDLTKPDVTIRISSTHHQALKFNDRMELIGIAPQGVAKRREFGPFNSFEKKDVLIVEGPTDLAKADVLPQVEACFYENTMSLCVQGHPELHGYPEFSSWFLDTIAEYIVQKMSYSKRIAGGSNALTRKDKLSGVLTTNKGD